jgi:hypothetical protein
MPTSGQAFSRKPCLGSLLQKLLRVPATNILVAPCRGKHLGRNLADDLDKTGVSLTPAA